MISIIDPKTQRIFINFYNKNFGNEDHSFVFRVFERNNGDYYSIHGKDIDAALKTSFKSTIIVKNMQPDELPGLKYASFNKASFEKILKELLLVIGFKVEVYTNRRSSEGKGDWVLEFKGSPGNLTQFEDILFNSAEPEVLTEGLLSVQLVSTQQQRVSLMKHLPFAHTLIHSSICRKLDSPSSMQLITKSRLLKLRTQLFIPNWKQLSCFYRQRSAFCHHLQETI